MVRWWTRWRGVVRRHKREVRILARVFRDPRTPWYARVVTFAVVAYALSPLDLIPDFIPIVGYLDDLIIVPLGIRLAVLMTPKVVFDDCRKHVESTPERPMMRWIITMGMLLLWLAIAILFLRALWVRW